MNLCMLLWIKRMRPPMGLYRFYFLCWYSPVLRGTLTLTVCWQAEAPIDHFSHSKQTKSPIIPCSVSEQNRLQGTDWQRWAYNPALPSWGLLCANKTLLPYRIYNKSHEENLLDPKVLSAQTTAHTVSESQKNYFAIDEKRYWIRNRVAYLFIYY